MRVTFIRCSSSLLLPLDEGQRWHSFCSQGIGQMAACFSLNLLTNLIVLEFKTHNHRPTSQFSLSKSLPNHHCLASAIPQCPSPMIQPFLLAHNPFTTSFNHLRVIIILFRPILSSQPFIDTLELMNPC